MSQPPPDGRLSPGRMFRRRGLQSVHGSLEFYDDALEPCRAQIGPPIFTVWPRSSRFGDPAGARRIETRSFPTVRRSSHCLRPLILDGYVALEPGAA